MATATAPVCPTCKGTGQIWQWGFDGKDWIVCPACKGAKR